MSIIVQKYGGALLATPEGREEVVSQVIAARGAGHQVVVVASAPGREGDPYATDTLLGLAQEVDPDVSPRTLDLLLSCGEIISTALLAHTLEQRGAPAVALVPRVPPRCARPAPGRAPSWAGPGNPPP